MHYIKTQVPASNHPDNKVLQDGALVSHNFFKSDVLLQHFLNREVSDKGKAYMKEKWDRIGVLAAVQMDKLSLQADKNPPELTKRDWYGNTIDEISFHPAYWELMGYAVDAEMFRVKWEPSLREKFAAETHKMGFGSYFLYTMGEGGIPCPLCMTDGVARIIDRYADEATKQRLLPRIYTDNPDNLATGAMFLTEKAGGSDVGANLVKATKVEGDQYILNGEKWFCSNANAEIILALARTDERVKGTGGLSIFLVERTLKDGTKNPIEVIRLKDKLGVRSMASAECVMTNTVGTLLGEEGQGFKIMAEMVNLSRVYNAVASTSMFRRALIEAYQFMSYRQTFGKNVMEHALVRKKLEEVTAHYISDFYLTWHAINMLDKADSGDKKAGELIRFLTPMIKKRTAQSCVYYIRECMEMMGGMGYIEDGVMPKIMRDAMVLPIWEGAGNIMALDMMRAALKSEGLSVMLHQISEVFDNNQYQEGLRALNKLVSQLKEVQSISSEEQECAYYALFEHLTDLYIISLLYSYSDDESFEWVSPTLDFWKRKTLQTDVISYRPKSKESLEKMIGWEIQ
ncbi:acyl-CoA dehydrogenase family protein [Limibacter armeniacum]|uniref:acyl-CoA dehydrogenase family protein n=1 Tax=Limibacter armeniacum TaxID=466084 RepID=UPI002FE513C8